MRPLKMQYLEAKINELCHKVSGCEDDQEATETARELRRLLHQFLENAQGIVVLSPALLRGGANQGQIQEAVASVDGEEENGHRILVIPFSKQESTPASRRRK